MRHHFQAETLNVPLWCSFIFLSFCHLLWKRAWPRGWLPLHPEFQNKSHMEPRPPDLVLPSLKSPADPGCVLAVRFSWNLSVRSKATKIWVLFVLQQKQLQFSILKSLLGVWVVQLVEHPTSAQVMISRSVNLSPVLGSVLTVQRLEPASDSVFPSLSVPPPLTFLSLSQR